MIKLISDFSRISSCFYFVRLGYQVEGKAGAYDEENQVIFSVYDQLMLVGGAGGASIILGRDTCIMYT